MIKTIKRILLSSLSVLTISVICWTVAFLNPSFMYANKTTVGMVTIHHNDVLDDQTQTVILNAIEIIKTSELYEEDIRIDLCLKEDSFYPELHPFKSGTAYSFWNKAVIYNSEPDFNKNIAEYSWEVNNYENRKADLTWLLAHEFTHNLQYNMDRNFIFKYDFWQQEGYAEYISRKWKDDGKLKEKIQYLLVEEKKEHIGLPVFLRSDGTIQILSYYKYGLMVQYLVEQEHLDFKKMGNDTRTFDKVYSEMVDWSQR